MIDPAGKKIIDFKKSNLHVLNYSDPINKKISLTELKRHLHTLPSQPNAIPYVTSYYKKDWGFCMSHNQFKKLKDGIYQVKIDSSLKNGHLTYSEFFLKGDTKDEILLTCYTCHPSLCNDNLSGIALITMLAKHLANLKLRYSYRFLFIPETIGAITWLKFNEKNLKRIKGGLVATCLGDSGNFTYKKSRLGNAEIDLASTHVLQNSKTKHKILDFFPYGSDERQFCSPGFNLPIGSLMRTIYGEFDEYHNSLDNLKFVKSKNLLNSFLKYLKIIFILENNKMYRSLNPKCEPNLGKRGLYKMLNNNTEIDIGTKAYHWILNLSDSHHSLLDISIQSNVDFMLLHHAANTLVENGLLKEIKK